MRRWRRKMRRACELRCAATTDDRRWQEQLCRWKDSRSWLRQECAHNHTFSHRIVANRVTIANAEIGNSPPASEMERLRWPCRWDHGAGGEPAVCFCLAFGIRLIYQLISTREGAKDLVEEYYRAQGGRPEKPQRGKRKSMTGPKQTTEKSEPKRRRKSRAEAATETPDEDDDLPNWVPRSKNWENEVQSVDTILRDAETSTLIAYLHWKNGKKSKVSLETCYEKCPRKVSLPVPYMLWDTNV